MLRGEGKATDGFKILAPLGVGGFGAVYEAIDQRTGERVAVKQLDDTSAAGIARFKHEFRALTDCHHQNLVGLRELIEQDGRWLIVMELVPGTDFLSYVRRADNHNDAQHGSPACDEGRLRKALLGVVEGLRALHGFGVVHRDLKPSNVRVRPDGRAVLLDFGLATSVDPKKQSNHTMSVGTVLYMAPEQAGGANVGPAADMYALGVCLFEALTGVPPFDGTHAIQVVLDKQKLPAPRAKSMVAHVPHELDELCARLLATEPEARPSSDEVLAILTRSPVRPSQPMTALVSEPTFAGREAELAHLNRALALTNEGEQRLVLVEGESGVGKTELVSEFLRRASLGHPRFLALRGRCYENEQVSYKAFDGCMDELATFLRRLSDAECAALLPERCGLLGQLFPVLRKIPAIANGSRERSSADPTARRLEAFAALSQLLTAIAEERPLVLVLDDLQWADSESFRLLHALRTQTARAPILLVATLRPLEELEPEVQAEVFELRRWREGVVISLLGLPVEQATTLARRLLGAHAPEHLLSQVVEESRGHPLFMSELVQYTQSHEFSMRGALTIDAALSARVDGLDRDARELLEMVALAARPYPGTVFAAALSREVDQTARKLLAAKLLRQRRGEICCFHDRIRHAAVSLIGRARLPALHHQLAAALDAFVGADPSEKARHWDLAAKPERASEAYEQAAQKALAVLAFTRAAEAFARAITLLTDANDPRIGPLTALRADALVWAGRSADAALLFQQAADRAHGEERIALRSNAVSHAMLGGRIDQGMAAAVALMRELGFVIPTRPLAWLLRFAWDALRARFVRLSVVVTPDHVSESEQIALRGAKRVMRAFSVIHPQLYVGLLMQYIRRSAKVGLRTDTAQALTMRGWLKASSDSLDAAKPLFEQARKLMLGETDPGELVAQDYATGSAYMMGLDWTGSLPYLTRAERLAQEECPQPWTLTTIRYHLGASWYHSGDYERVAREPERWLAEAYERNDVLGAGLLAGMGYGFIRHLMRDDPQAALDELARTAGALPAEPYSFVHLGEMLGGTLSRLYMGGSEAQSFLDGHFAKHSRAFILRTRSTQEGRATLRILVLLSAYAAASAPARPPLLEAAKRAARKARRARSRFAQASLALAQAQLYACEGRTQEALAQGREALTRFRALQHAYQLVAEFLLGLLQGGAEGQRQCAKVTARLREQGWRDPMRMLTMHAPTMRLLWEQHRRAPSEGAPLLCDRYAVRGQLGRGGFGTVIAAHDVHSGRDVALKELVRKGGTSLERFKQEFRALADIHHEHIVRLEELCEHQGTWYIAMERIGGEDLAAYVRASGRCDPERLRRTALGLVRALQALHQRGFVHRDVKPENVLVGEDGRAVLIDFGLIARIGDARDAGPVGSVHFAAPEQLAGALPAPEADVFALGMTLYSVIRGENPFSELTLSDRLQPKHKTPPAMAVEGLEELCLLLQLMLAANPAMRPSLADLVQVLDGTRASHELQGSHLGSDEPGHEEVFRGREQEQVWLQGVLERARHAGLRIALLEGESGLGKSALVHHFVRGAKGARGPVQVFRSRCYEHERVAFKAFDGMVDQLAIFLRELPPATCEALLPKRAALLAQLFPVLGGVPAIAAAPKKGLPADPSARKQGGIECFIQLLERLAAQHELVLVIDDLQWADEESFELLRALTGARDRLPIALLCPVRPATELEGDAQSALAELRGLPCCELLALGPLEASALSSLAAELLGDLEPARLSQLTHESGGHPLFLRELVEQEKRGVRPAQQALSLDGALLARISGLERQARELLALVALADKPHPLHMYAGTMEGGGVPREVLIALLGQGLLQRRGNRLACYHDRIRRVVLGGLSAAERAGLARRLARALAHVDAALKSTSKSDAAERARLWDEAGDASEAVAAYEQAGDEALEVLAFARAEQHYARALALLGDVQNEAWQRLSVSRGHALVRAGRSGEAARCFEAAARQAQGDSKVRLRVWAAQHLIQSAQVGPGMQAARELLAELGIVLPETERAAKGRIVWERARVKVRGVALKRGETSAQEALALQALHELSAPVRAASFLAGSALVTQYLRRALDVGDPRHAARALAFEALWRVLRRPERSEDALFERSSTLAADSQEHALIAEVALTQGLAAIAQSKFDAATTHLWRAHDQLVNHCPGQPWLLTSVRMQLGTTWFYNGKLAELQEAGRWLEEARARDDRYAFAALSGFGYASLRHALAGDAEAGLAELEAASAFWPSEPMSTVQIGMLLAANPLLGICRSGPGYLRVVEQQEARVARSTLMQSTFLRFLWRVERMNAMLSCIGAPQEAGAAALIARAKAEFRLITKVPGEHATSIQLFFSAWFALLGGDTAAARQQLEGARALLGRSPFYMPAIDYTLGRLEGGDSGRARCAAAIAQLRQEGWRDIRHGLAIRMPVSLELCDRLIGTP